MMGNKYNFDVYNFRAAEVPTYQEVIYNKPWVYYGADNLFPNHILALYQYSAIHRACVNAIVYGVQGKDIVTDKGTYLMANSTESLFDVYKKVVVDRVLFGGFGLNTILSNDGGLAEFYHMDYSRLRVGVANELNKIDKYFYSIDWNKKTKYKPVELPAFNLINTDQPSQVYIKQNYIPGMSYYSAPDYIAALTTIQLDIEIKNFHINNTQNSMIGSQAVIFKNGTPGEEERDIIYRQLEEKYASTNNAGRFFLFFSDNPETAPEIVPLQTNATDAWYSQLYPQIEATILSAHRLTSPQIVGVKTAGQLGGREELLDAYDLFLNIVIKPIQEEILKEFEKLIFIRDGVAHKLSITQNQILSDKATAAVDEIKGI
jgi:hypothetical protein